MWGRAKCIYILSPSLNNLQIIFYFLGPTITIHEMLLIPTTLPIPTIRLPQPTTLLQPTVMDMVPHLATLPIPTTQLHQPTILVHLHTTLQPQPIQLLHPTPKALPLPPKVQKRVQDIKMLKLCKLRWLKLEPAEQGFKGLKEVSCASVSVCFQSQLDRRNGL